MSPNQKKSPSTKGMIIKVKGINPLKFSSNVNEFEIHIQQKKILFQIDNQHKID